jgi:DHA3 family macrolide efflux protein-like MFS transporter
MIAWSSLPLAYLAAGPLADQVFEPLMDEGGALANSVGQIIGTGQGRGIGLLYMILGIISLLATGVGFLYPRLRQVEMELPDIVIDGDDRVGEVVTRIEFGEAPHDGLEL